LRWPGRDWRQELPDERSERPRLPRLVQLLLRPLFSLRARLWPRARVSLLTICRALGSTGRWFWSCGLAWRQLRACGVAAPSPPGRGW
jgi:hypothetical protein